jgi:uncharacterized protein YacL
MVLVVLRALFILLMGAVGWYFVEDPRGFLNEHNWLALAMALAIGVLFVCVDILAPRKKLAVFSGTFLGLIVGILSAYGLSFAVNLVVDQWQPSTALSREDRSSFYDQRDALREFVNMLVGVTSCYLSISFILQTKDDFRFIIPYVEFTRQTKGARPILLDTSVLIDGRISDIANTGILESSLIVPKFVLDELQIIADSGEKLRRNRGRRGLDVLQKLQANPRIEVVLYDASATPSSGHPDLDVDQRLLMLAMELQARVLTNDFNLNKVATLRGVSVINVNDLATALKPVVLPGERMQVRLLKQGEESGQGVGYLEDGTMVVVEQGRPHLNEEVEFTVTNVVQTSAGKMIFGRLIQDPSARKPKARLEALPPTA